MSPPLLPRFLLRLRAGSRSPRRFLLLGLLGMLMAATPLGEVLRRQASDLEKLIAARAALDPLADTVAVQRALLTHRVTAALVLEGRRDAEAARQARRHDVDERLSTLTTTLERGRYAAAAAENDALREDWHALAERIGRREIALPACEQAHDLLVDQTLQIGDLLMLEGGLHGAAERAGISLLPWATTRHAVRDAMRQAAPWPDPAPTARPGDARLAALEAAIGSQEAELAALRTQLALAGSRLERAQLAWQALLAVLGLLALLALLLAWSPNSAPRRRPPPGTPPTSDPGPESRAPTEALIQRLRSAENHDKDPSHPAGGR